MFLTNSGMANKFRPWSQSCCCMSIRVQLYLISLQVEILKNMHLTESNFKLVLVELKIKCLCSISFVLAWFDFNCLFLYKFLMVLNK